MTTAADKEHMLNKSTLQKIPGDLGMFKKAKKQGVSTQCLAHHIFLEIFIPIYIYLLYT